MTRRTKIHQLLICVCVCVFESTAKRCTSWPNPPNIIIFSAIRYEVGVYKFISKSGSQVPVELMAQCMINLTGKVFKCGAAGAFHV